MSRATLLAPGDPIEKKLPLNSDWKVVAHDYASGLMQLYPVGAPWPMQPDLAVWVPRAVVRHGG